MGNNCLLGQIYDLEDFFILIDAKDRSSYQTVSCFQCERPKGYQQKMFNFIPRWYHGAWTCKDCAQ